MKHIALIITFLLAGCAVSPQVTQTTGVQPPSVQAQWYAACKGWSVAEPQVAAKMLTAPLSQVQAALPVSQAISQMCEAPMPANAQAATTQLTTNITQVLTIFGLQQAIQGTVK